jgi:hypothetical protein
MLLWLSMVLTVDPSVTLHAVHSPVLEPVSLNVIGVVENVEFKVTRWREATIADFSVRSSSFDLDAVLDTRLSSTRVEVKVVRATRLEGIGAWELYALPTAKLALLSGTPTQLRVGFLRHLGLPFSSAVVPSSEGEVLRERVGRRLECTVSAVHASSSEQSPRWTPPLHIWSLVRGSTSGEWTKVWSEAEGLVIFAWVRATDFNCGAGSGGGFEVRSQSEVSKGYVDARRVELAAGTALFSSPDGGSRVAVLHTRSEALVLADGSVMLEVKTGTARLLLQDVYAATAVAEKSTRKLRGFGTTASSSDDWPHPCSDAGVCYDPL